MNHLDGLEPREVWRWFQELCAIPRPSGSEEQVADFLVRFAEERGLEHKRDGMNNVLIRKSGTGTSGDHNPLALQAHVDMVAEKKQGSTHDFSRDPILPVIQGDWVTSPQTTLGADNGIGVALMLAALDSESLSHPDLWCLFTSDEERGLTGASNLDPEWLEPEILINLDSEGEGIFTIGCAGGSDFLLKMEPAVFGEQECWNLSVSGLKGGHSGIEIHKNRGNAILFLGRVLARLKSDCGCLVANIQGGSKRNAIPREARALIALEKDAVGRAKEIVETVFGELEDEYSGIEEGFRITLENSGTMKPVLGKEDSGRLLDILSVLPHGVIKMSGVIPGLVETSVNLAKVTTMGTDIEIAFSCRSPLESARNDVGRRIEACGRLAGLAFSSGGSYPGWIPNADSPLLGRMIRLYSDIFHTEPVVESIHAGLECGIIGARAGGMDMVSIGPDIKDVHIPGERVSISSMQRFWKFFTALLKDLD